MTLQQCSRDGGCLNRLILDFGTADPDNQSSLITRLPTGRAPAKEDYLRISDTRSPRSRIRVDDIQRRRKNVCGFLDGSPVLVPTGVVKEDDRRRFRFSEGERELRSKGEIFCHTRFRDCHNGYGRWSDRGHRNAKHWDRIQEWRKIFPSNHLREVIAEQISHRMSLVAKYFSPRAT